MKQDANSIVREHGVAHLRRVFDQAPMLDPRDNAGAPSVDSLDAFGVSSKETPTVTVPRFVPIAIDDVTMAAEPAWLIDGLLPARGLACIVGPPKSGKSFLTSDMLCAVARGASYAGRETLPGPVIYLTGEGVSGFKRRLVAMRRHLGIEGHGVPFFMIENVPDLGSEATDLQQLLAELDAFLAQVCPDGPRAIALDTLARCMGEADENSARDMGRFVNRCAAIERHFGCVVVVVHHVGKDPSRGGRGSNSLNGAADVTMLVEKTEACSKVRIDEMKDGREGQEWTFRLVPYDLGATFEASCAPPSATSENSTCVVEILSEPGKAQPRATSKASPPSGVAGDLLKIIRRAVDEVGTTTTDSATVPNHVRAATREDLKRYCNTMAWQDEAEPRSWSAQLSNNLSKLRDRGLIGFDKGWVWQT
jgi:hypothetical protein